MPYLERPDGSRLYFELHGDATSPPIVLLEGSGGDIPGWGLTIEHLADRFRVVAHDLRGNGRSEMPDQPVAMEDFVHDTGSLMDHAGIDRAHLYGQSFGGMVGQELALAFPGRVRSLILAATHCGGAHTIRGRAKVPKDRPYLALFSESFARDHPDRVAERQRLAARSPQPPHAARRQWKAMQAFDACDRLRTLRLPVLILHGEQDRLIDPANATALAERIPGARLILVPGAGHVYHWEQPDRADGAVADFVLDVETAGNSP
jgi:3-oxoadipate enol-lactonase